MAPIDGANAAPPTDLDLDLLRDLVDAPGPSGFEARPAAVWRARAEALGASVREDAYGNVIATFGAGGSPRAMLLGHLDEIGLLITHVDDEGRAWFQGIGGWDPQQLVGQRVRVLGRSGDVLGVIGKKPIHLMKQEERTKAATLDELWIDVGARDGARARERLEPGDVAVLEQPLIALMDGRVAAKALDDRAGAFAVLEAARRAAAAGAAAEIVAVATVQEEIGGVGAAAAAFRLDPDAAIAVDVTHATDVPGVDRKREGHSPLGSGVELSVGSVVHRGVQRRLRDVAEREGVPVTLGFAPRSTATDGDHVARSRAGVPTGVVSIPLRYMHSGVEVIDLADLEAVVRLLAAWLVDLGPDDRVQR